VEVVYKRVKWHGIRDLNPRCELDRETLEKSFIQNVALLKVYKEFYLVTIYTPLILRKAVA
jgi:hypothetical protein